MRAPSILLLPPLAYPINQSPKSQFAFRCSLLESAVFDLVDNYVRFCKETDVPQPIWLFSALVECQGFRFMTNRRFHDFSEKSVDRSPAFIPAIEITSFDSDSKKLLQPWCDTLWQTSGLEKSLNYDQEGNWQAPR